MATLKKFQWVAAVALLGLTSCLSEGKHSYSFFTPGVVQRSAQDSSQWWFMADDSATFVAANGYSIPSTLHRAIMYMEQSSAIKQQVGYSYTVNFLGHERVDVLPVTATSADSLNAFPADALVQVTGNTSLQYLNVSAFFNGEDGAKHEFYLLRDSLQIDEPLKLYLRHSRGGDSEYQPQGKNMSFDLETLAERGTQDTVRLRVMLSATDSVKDFTYRFCR